MNNLTETAALHPEIGHFLHHLARTNLYRSWIPRKPVTLLAPTNGALGDIPHGAWRDNERELFVLRHALPGRLTFDQILRKSRVLTLSGDLIAVPSATVFRRAANPVFLDLMSEGIMIHGIDAVVWDEPEPPTQIQAAQDAWAQLDLARMGYRFSTSFTTADGSPSPTSRLLLPQEVETMFLDPFQRWVVGE